MHYFARNLKYLRRRKKLSQEELAGLVGLNRGNIASYEKQTAEPNMLNLVRIGKFFNTDLNELLEKDFSARETLIGQLDQMESGTGVNHEKVEEILIESLENHQDKIEKFRKRSDEMARILEGFKLFHKFRMEQSDSLSDDVRKMALDYEKLLEVLEEVMSTNKHILQLIEKQD
jgi:transcriptional regulator with XRE-family HTH domain